jgi:hypothetical protein
MAELEYADLDIREADARSTGSGIFFDIVAGFFEPSSTRGGDTVIPGLAGRVSRNRVKDVRRILLEGFVIGTSASDWATNTAALMAVMDPSLDAEDLVLDDDYLGVTGTGTIAARVVNVVGGPIVAARFQTWSIELESVAPDWAVT